MSAIMQPEARLWIDGDPIEEEALNGQPNHAYLPPGWVNELQQPPPGPSLISIQSGAIEPRMAWARVRHQAPDAAWLPAGIQLTLRFRCE